jgi:Holliday junction resolvasome RuvABC endonuclease subunit
VIVLGLDPALRTMGYALLSVSGAGEERRTEPIAMGMIATRPDPSLSRSEDNFRSAGLLAEGLMALVVSPRTGETFVDAICAEAMSYPPGAASASRISIAWGVVATIALIRGIVDVRQASPQKIKAAIVGSISASKDEVRGAMAKRFGPWTIDRLLAGVKEGDREHPCDALAAAVALIDPPVPTTDRRRSVAKKRRASTRRKTR